VSAAPASSPIARLLQLASPALPIGAFSYSHGLEAAVDAAVVHDAASARAWIGDALHLVMGQGDAPLAWRLLCSAHDDMAAFASWNAWYAASRETWELRAETAQMGHSLLSLARDLGVLDAPALTHAGRLDPVTFPAAYALAARGFGIDARDALVAYVWSWLENQALAALKLVPLGQVATQRLLLALGSEIEGVVAAAIALDDDAISTFAPGFAIASAAHETQYSRLFRS